MSEHAISALPLKAISLESADLSRLLSQLEPSVQLGELGLALSLATPNMQEHVVVTLSLPATAMEAERPMRCRIPLDQAMQWFSIWLQGADVEALPRALLETLLAERYVEQGEPLKSLLGDSARWLSCRFEALCSSEEDWIKLSTAIPGTANPLDIWVESGAKHFLARWPKVPPSLPSGNAHVTTLIGQTRLDVWEYSRLAVGDVVFLDQSLVSQGVVAIKINGKECWKGSFEGRQITCIEPLMSTMLDQEDVMAADIEEIPVDLAFEIGSIRLSLAEVANLNSGYVFELADTTDQPVKVRVGDQLVGRGELVSLNDKLGVRLTQWQGTDSGELTEEAPIE